MTYVILFTFSDTMQIGRGCQVLGLLCYIVVAVLVILHIIKKHTTQKITWACDLRLLTASVIVAFLARKYYSSCLQFNLFPHADASVADDFSKHCDKIRNCSYWAISPFATMFSTLVNNYLLIYRDFLYFFKNVFKVAFSRFLVFLFIWYGISRYVCLLWKHLS